MAVDDARRAWFGRFFGVAMPPPGEAGHAAEGPLLPIWLDAKEAIDVKLGQLQSVLREFDNPDLDRIAEFGLNGITDRNSVGLMTALREADAPGAGDGARARLAAAIQSYRSFLNDNTIVKLIDANPFGVSLSLKSTLGGALATLERRIAA